MTASLYADEYCGVEDTSVIMYVNRGSVFSRYFTSKDTHSPRGDLLVVYGSARASYRDSQLAKHTAFLLGSDAPVSPPSFTYGTDLMLPVGANKDLRELLMSGDAEEMEEAMAALVDLDDLTAVPQVRSERAPCFFYCNSVFVLYHVPKKPFVARRSWFSRHEKTCFYPFFVSC